MRRAVRLSDNPGMARLQAKAIGSPDEVRSFPNGRVEIYRARRRGHRPDAVRAGLALGEHVKPIAGTASCQYHHLGVCVSGRLGIRMDDGTTFEVGPGTVFDIPAGHDGWVIGDEPWETYDVAGMRSFGRSVETATESSRRSCSPMSSTRRRPPSGWATPAGGSSISTLNERCQFEVRPAARPPGQDDRRRHPRHVRQLRTGGSLRGGGDQPGARARLGLRAGIHTGEVELAPGDVRGLAVHVASRILALAGAGEVYVSGTTLELLAGSSLAFDDRGEHELKGISGRAAGLRPGSLVHRSERLRLHQPDRGPDRRRARAPRPAPDEVALRRRQLGIAARLPGGSPCPVLADGHPEGLANLAHRVGGERRHGHPDHDHDADRGPSGQSRLKWPHHERRR